MLMYSTAFSRSETPLRFKPGIPEGLWEGVLLFPMDTSQGNIPASLASLPFWEAIIRVYPLSPCKGWSSSLVVLTFPPATQPQEQHQYLPRASPWAASAPAQGAMSGHHYSSMTRNSPSPDYTHRHFTSCNTTPFPSPKANYSSRESSARIHSFTNLWADNAEYRWKLSPTAAHIHNHYPRATSHRSFHFFKPWIKIVH